MTIKCILELIGCLLFITFVFWWLLSATYRTSLIAIIYWNNGRIEESKEVFLNLEEYDTYVDMMYHSYPEQIHHIEYEFINPKVKK